MLLHNPEYNLCRVVTIFDHRISKKIERRDTGDFDGDVDIEVIRRCAERLPNQDLDWDDWNRLMMALWASSGGSEDGREIARVWSSKSTKHDDAAFDKRWDHFSTSPPTDLSAGTIIHESGGHPDNIDKADNLELPEDPPELIMGDDRLVIDMTPELADLFNLDRPEFYRGDKHNYASYDMAIANWCKRNDKTPVEAWAYIRTFRHEQHGTAAKKADRRAYVASIIDKVYVDQEPDEKDIPNSIEKLIKSDELLSDAWYLGKKISRGGSNTLHSKDAQLANYLAIRVDEIDDIKKALEAYPHGSFIKKGKNDKWMGKLVEMIGERKEKHAKKSEAWKGKLLLDENMNIAKHVANAAIALKESGVFNLRYDELKEAPVALNLPWRRNGKLAELEDADDVLFAEWCQHRDLNISPRTAHDALNAVCLADTFNPVKEYLESLEWDGTPRIENWLLTHLGADVGEGDQVERRTKYIKAIGKKWLISAVARAFCPGCKVDTALIIQGEQGIKKSTAIRTLIPNVDWFADGISDMGSKDSAQDLRGKWVIELAELASMTKASVEKVKAFISRQSDHIRVAYGRRSQDFPRRGVFAGSTNDEEFLQDVTGNRRFWIVKAHHIDLEGLERVRDQLWAEAVQAYQAGEVWYLNTTDEEAIAREIASEKIISDPWEEEIQKWINIHYDPITKQIRSDAYLTYGAIFDHIQMPKDRQDQKAKNRLVRCFQKLGLKRTQS
ncbi:MAG: VapE domain-containing protein, partial [Geminicoccaceae bacterium]